VKEINKMQILIENELRQIIEPTVERAVAKALEKVLGNKPRYGRFLSVDQLAKESGYSKHSIYQMSSNKQIPGAMKIGSKLLFETEVALDWIASGCPKLKRS
jgi:predicted DNA-binding transcriptional regulator AlpA